MPNDEVKAAEIRLRLFKDGEPLHKIYPDRPYGHTVLLQKDRETLADAYLALNPAAGPWRKPPTWDGEKWSEEWPEDADFLCETHTGWLFIAGDTPDGEGDLATGEAKVPYTHWSEIRRIAPINTDTTDAT